MTAEVGILNRNAVVLAADSTSTLTVAGKSKFISVNKLFALSKHVGIMVYNNAYFTNIPWELVIKVYTLFIKSISFDTLQEYCDSFLKFLISEPRIYDPNYENKLVESVLEYCLKEVGIQIKSRQEPEMSVEKQIEEKLTYFSNLKFSDGFDEKFLKSFVEKHQLHLKAYINDMVNVSIDSKTQQNIILLCANIISKSDFLINTMPASGIVIAGYGSKEIFPSLNEYKIIGIISGNLIYQIKNSVKIYEASNIPTNTFSTIMTFAQTEIVETYTLGIDTDIKNAIFNDINNIFSNFYDVLISEFDNTSDHIFSNKEIDKINAVGLKLKKQIEDSFSSVQTAKYIEPFKNMAGFLGKEEMAALAESLVNLTSNRRRFTTDDETVGGATDVAIITNSEGFVWIKKK